MNTIQNNFTVLANEKVCPKFYRLCMEADRAAKNVAPGQFVHIRVKDGLKPFFRRPFSVHRAGKHLEILYEVVGDGTRILSAKKKGDRIDVLGPLGTPFCLPPAGIKQAVMIAGGVGIAPFLILSDVLKKKKLELVVLYGGRTREYVYPMKEFKSNGCEVFISTDDGSAGTKGRVTKLFCKMKPDSQSTFIYTCGPRPMMAAVQEFARKHGVQGQASCEEVMACGIGTCLGCVIKTRHGYKTVCNDGPVFDLNEIIFD